VVAVSVTGSDGDGCLGVRAAAHAG
jgi:hypothetical protein